MMQVDVYCTYSLGGILAWASGKDLLAQPSGLYANKYFVQTMAILSLIWAPSGLSLLLMHPSWETMQVADTLASVPPWLIIAFCITNITQGIVGYSITACLMKRQMWRIAALNASAGFGIMFLLLTCGWDGHGYDRFLYDRSLAPLHAAWIPASALSLDFVVDAASRFLWGPVCLMLTGWGIALFAAMGVALWLSLKAWNRPMQAKGTGPWSWGGVPILLARYTAAMVGLPFLFAVFCLIMVSMHATLTWAGSVSGAAMCGWLLFSTRGVFFRLLAPLLNQVMPHSDLASSQSPGHQTVNSCATRP